MSIEEMYLKIKEFTSSYELVVVFIVVLVGFSSFGLGRLSVLEKNKQSVQIVYPKEKVTTSKDIKENIPKTGQFIASRNGTKYHFPWCGGSQQIKEENKIYFNSREEAEGAGYTPAKNCKGL